MKKISIAYIVCLGFHSVGWAVKNWRYIFQKYVQKNPVRDYSLVEEGHNRANPRMPLGMRTNTKSCCIPDGMPVMNAEHFLYQTIIPNGIKKGMKKILLMATVLMACMLQSWGQTVSNPWQIYACQNATPPYYIYTRPDNGEEVYCTAGLNTIYLNDNSWDSTVYINVNLVATINWHAYRKICKNDKLWFGGRIFHGADYDVGINPIPNITVHNPYGGCDTIFTLHLTVKEEYNYTIKDDICFGEEYFSYGFGIPAQYTAGTFEHTINPGTHLGCDSIITLKLTVHPPKNTTIYAAILEGDTYTENGFNESVAGTYTRYGTSVAGCDSTTTLILTVYKVCPTCVVNRIEATVCANDTPYYHQQHEGWLIPCVEGLQKVDSIHINNTKDSIVFVNLTVIPNPVRPTYKTLCHNETYNFYGNIVNGADFQLGNDTLEFYVSSANTSECDNLMKLVLTIVEAYNDTIYESVCQGDTYYKNGFAISADLTANAGIIYRSRNPQIHYDGLDDGCLCDNIITLKLTVNPHKDTTIYAGICEGETYSENGFNESVQGTYPQFLTTAEGCDSIVTLNLWVYSAGKNHEFNAEICEGNVYRANGFNVNATGTYTDDRVTKDGCPYTVTLNLKVLKNLKMDILPLVGEICGDAANFPVRYKVFAGKIDSIFVSFNEKAHNAGFRNFVERNPSNDTGFNYIYIPLPNNVLPDNYSVTLYFDGRCSDATFTVNFTVLYPSSVMEQRWNDVIVLKNPAYNGGYYFSDIQWFVDGYPIYEKFDKGSYIYTENETLQFGSEYRVLLTREGEYQSFYSCPLIPQKHSNHYEFPRIDNPPPYIVVSECRKIKVYSDEPIVDLSLINMLGQTLIRKQYAHTEIEINADAGVYIVRLVTDKGQIHTQKIIIPQ